MAESADLAAAADELFRRELTRERRREAEATGWSEGLWAQLQQSGLAAVGWEAGLEEAAEVVRIAARHAAPVPIGETSILAAWVLAEAGFDVPPGPLAVGHFVNGVAENVPFGRHAGAVISVSDAGVAVLEGGYALEMGANLAGEPRDRLRLLDPPSGTRPGPAWMRVEERGALLRSIELAGALEAVLEMTVGYAEVRRQFGAPLLRFQAVQEQVALLAAEVAAAQATVAGAIDRPERHMVAAAKIRTGQAAGVGVRVAHQVHGAIGFTAEHDLHHLTRRLLSWRDEHGTEHEWAQRLGSELEPTTFWEVTTR